MEIVMTDATHPIDIKSILNCVSRMVVSDDACFSTTFGTNVWLNQYTAADCIRDGLMGQAFHPSSRVEAVLLGKSQSFSTMFRSLMPRFVNGFVSITAAIFPATFNTFT